ncbi:hypothetical protein ACFFMP_06870 [Pseudoroseomonas cervicalis]|uniref:Uncharacterized protein n=1 Tax=Pseudoroseomonas cervicalis ATCC 49957 TaxID=525371 RepID=D5RLR5_9PROT|nr:hypothetical protein [Pseudoroseomonas cervicalis]EFH11758.1 hypothetical protein HMPREF0731_2026 [Pseudoroseomonas cervicalis ATCC 49957]
MRLARLAAAGLLALGTAAAQAQGTGPGPGPETMFRELDRPLQALLDEGWQITGMAGNLGGLGFVLQREGKWVTCTLVSRREDTRSRCMALN